MIDKTADLNQNSSQKGVLYLQDDLSDSDEYDNESLNKNKENYQTSRSAQSSQYNDDHFENDEDPVVDDVSSEGSCV